MRVFLVVLVVIVLGAAGAAAWYLLSPDRSADAATAAADAFVAAWSAEDWAELDTLATGLGAADAHASAVEEVDASSVQVVLTHLGLDQLEEGVAPARYEASYQLDGLGTWTHEGRFDVVETEDDWLVDWEPAVLHPEREQDFAFGRTLFWPERAEITGPGGIDLAGEDEVVIVGIEPQRVDDADEVAEAIDELTPATAADASQVLDRDDLRDDWFYPVVTMTRPAYDEVRDDLWPVPGLVFQEDSGRTGASPAVDELIGHVDEVTAEQLEQLGSPYQQGDLVGRTGLEASLERRLAGEPGGAVVLLDGDGQEVATLEEFPPSEPEPVELTLDVDAQDAAAEALEGVEAGALVALDASSGAIRAAVSRPADGFPRAFTGQYAPGSTFKVVTTVALLTAGVGPGDEVECPGEFTAGGRSFRNAGDADLGSITLAEAVAESCNTAFIGEAAQLPDGALAEAAERFGFGEGDDGDYYEVAGRRVPASFPTPGDEAEAAAAAIGQGRVTGSPVQMASVAATATTGVRVMPHLLAEDASESEEALPDDVVEALRAMLRGVVTDGTGTAADASGEVVGKTGTAQHDGGVEHAWFIGERAGLAFAVLVEEGGAGSEAAAPVAARFLDALDG